MNFEKIRDDLGRSWEVVPLTADQARELIDSSARETTIPKHKAIEILHTVEKQGCEIFAGVGNRSACLLFSGVLGYQRIVFLFYKKTLDWLTGAGLLQRWVPRDNPTERPYCKGCPFYSAKVAYRARGKRNPRCRHFDACERATRMAQPAKEAQNQHEQ